jgi:decaprenylphospho-beta-D-erythro-pentofuranosid-2-ulose 2-reductase
MRRITVIGASSAIAEACMQSWCTQEPTHFVLVGRREDTLQAIACDLLTRGCDGTSVSVHTAAFRDTDTVAAAVAAALAHGRPDIALVAFGSLPDQASVSAGAEALSEALEVNGVWPALCAQLLFNAQRDGGGGRLVLLGSVAGDRGRRSNYAYGAAKALLATFAAGLAHAAVGTGVSVSLVKPGPTDTPMTRTAGTRGRLASPEAVARTIVAGVDSGRPVIYAPPRWRAIMTVIRALPRPLFDRLDI